MPGASLPREFGGLARAARPGRPGRSIVANLPPWIFGDERSTTGQRAIDADELARLLSVLVFRFFWLKEFMMVER